MRDRWKKNETLLEGVFEEGRKSIDVPRIKLSAEEACRTIRKIEEAGIPESLRSIWKDIRDLYYMICDTVKGKCNTPFRTISAVAFTLVYLTNPFDVMPDVIPLIGYIDDAFVVTLCLKFIETDLEKYRKWKYGASAGKTDIDI